MLLLTSYGCFLELIKLSFDKPQHQAGFAYSHVTQQHQFELTDLGLRQGAVGADSTPSGVHSSLYWRRLGVLGLLPLWSEALTLSSKLNMVRFSLSCQNEAGLGHDALEHARTTKSLQDQTLRNTTPTTDVTADSHNNHLMPKLNRSKVSIVVLYLPWYVLYVKRIATEVWCRLTSLAETGETSHRNQVFVVYI